MATEAEPLACVAVTITEPTEPTTETTTDEEPCPALPPDDGKGDEEA